MKKFFGTDGIRGRVGEVPITADWVLKLGWALGEVLSTKKLNSRPKVLIGKDTRISGYLFESALEAGLSSAGVDTLLLGPMPTPAIAYLTSVLKAQAGIVISASHNPYHDNGIKFFSSEGLKISDAMEFAIEETMMRPMVMVDSRNIGKAERARDAEERYLQFCKQTALIPLNLQNMKIVLDCANGATYHVGPAIFRELGGTIIEMGVNPDGYNINDHCGSTYPQSLAEKVIQEKADIGIAFDGDGDRLIMVDHKGEIVDGDEILFIIAKWYAAHQRLKGGVVGTVMSNFGLEHAFKCAGIEFSRVAVGDRHILEFLKRNAWNLGGESSGHIICLDANTTGDGIVSALRVLTVMISSSRSLHELKQGMTKFPQTLINVPMRNKNNVIDYPTVKSAVESIKKRLKEEGRVLLRASGTEPLIRVMVEGKDAKMVQSLALELAEVVSQEG